VSPVLLKKGDVRVAIYGLSHIKVRSVAARFTDQKKIQFCGSGMFIPDPGSRILIFTHPGSRIPDPKTATKERGEKNLLSQLFM
jgi:hypothetical protein